MFCPPDLRARSVLFALIAFGLVIIFRWHVPVGNVRPFDGRRFHPIGYLTSLLPAVAKVPRDRTLVLDLLARLLVETDHLQNVAGCGSRILDDKLADCRR